jgi:hypothetical protein
MRIRTSPACRTPCVDPRQWIVQPLIEAGLDPDTITDLLVRLSVEGLTASGDVDDRIRVVANGQPRAVRAAWVETLSRMIAAADLVP